MAHRAKTRGAPVHAKAWRPLGPLGRAYRDLLKTGVLRREKRTRKWRVSLGDADKTPPAEPAVRVAEPKNRFKVPATIWADWSPSARIAFNAVYVGIEGALLFNRGWRLVDQDRVKFARAHIVARAVMLAEATERLHSQTWGFAQVQSAAQAQALARFQEPKSKRKGRG